MNKNNSEILSAYKLIQEDEKQSAITGMEGLAKQLQDIDKKKNVAQEKSNKLPSDYYEVEKNWTSNLKKYWEDSLRGIPKNDRNAIKKYKESLIDYIDDKILVIPAIKL